MTLIVGVGKSIIKGDVQAAIRAAGTAYRARFNRPPTHISLPPGTDTASVSLYTLTRGHDSGPGFVVVGEACPQEEKKQ